MGFPSSLMFIMLAFSSTHKSPQSIAPIYFFSIKRPHNPIFYFMPEGGTSFLCTMPLPVREVLREGSNLIPILIFCLCFLALSEMLVEMLDTFSRNLLRHKKLNAIQRWFLPQMRAYRGKKKLSLHLRSGSQELNKTEQQQCTMFLQSGQVW